MLGIRRDKLYTTIALFGFVLSLKESTIVIPD
jgi:hypothetical protein